MRRRAALSVLGGLVGTAGCLRLESSDGGATETKWDATTDSRITTATETTSQAERSSEETTTEEATTEEATTEEATTEEETTEGAEAVVDASGSVPMHAYDAANTGFSDVAGPTTKPRAAWETTLVDTDRETRGVMGMPTLADRTLFTATGEGVVAVAAGSGQVRWREDARPARTPAVIDGRVFANGYRETAAYVADSGDSVWGRNWSTRGVTVVDDTAFVASNEGLRAVDPASGGGRWQSLQGTSIDSAPAVVDGHVYVGTRGGSVRAFDADSGSEIWQFTPGADDGSGNYAYFISSPSVVDGTVYACSQNRVCYAIDAATGSLVWQYESNGGMNPTPAVADGTVYVGNDGGYVLALDAESGEKLWTGKSNTGPITIALTVDRNQVYAMDDAGLLVAYDRDSGDPNWKYGLSRSETRTAPTVVDGRVFVGDGVGKLYALTA